MAKRRLTKVKVTKDDKIHIEYEQKSGLGWDEYQFTCSEKARPAFYGALDLSQYVAELCELPEDYADRIKVRGVSFSYGGEKEVMGATVSAQMKLNKSYCPLNLNTPHKASEPYSEGPADEMQLLPGKLVEALKELYGEALAYIDGERAQGKLFAVS